MGHGCLGWITRLLMTNRFYFYFTYPSLDHRQSCTRNEGVSLPEFLGKVEATRVCNVFSSSSVLRVAYTASVSIDCGMPNQKPGPGPAFLSFPDDFPPLPDLGINAWNQLRKKKSHRPHVLGMSCGMVGATPNLLISTRAHYPQGI